MAKFNQLPAAIQQMLQAAVAQGLDPSCLPHSNFNLKQATGYNGVWAVPHLEYDFNESDYGVDTVNLTDVASLDVGAASCTMMVKTDPMLPAWILVSTNEDDMRFEIIECV